MAIRPLNSIAGFSTGDPAFVVIQANGDVTTVNVTANGVIDFTTASNVALGNVGNVHITGGNADQYLKTDGLGNLTWDSIGNLSSNRAAVMPYNIPTGQSYIVPENLQGLYSQTITIDGELEVDGILIEVPISFAARPTQVLFAENGNPTGREGFTFNALSGNLAVPGNISITGSIVPTADDSFDLGNSIRRWRNGYFGGNTIYLDSASISVNNDGYLILTNEYGGEFIVSGNSTSGSNALVYGDSNVIINSDGNVSVGISNVANVLVVSTTGATVTGNLIANGVKTDNLYYANGSPWDLQQPAGSNTQVQFNNNNDFGASSAFTFNSTTNTLQVTGNSTTGIGAINAGATNTILPNTIASFSANVNYYTQVTLQNKSNGADATADFIVTADNGSDTVNYLDLGIINSGYDANTPTNSLGNIVAAGDSYVYAQGNTGNTSQSGGNLAVGTTVPGKNVKIFAGGTNNQSIIANIANTGVTVNGNLNVNTGTITGNGAGLSQLAGGNVTGQVGNALVAGTVYTNAQPNITSVGTLTSVNVTGNGTFGNVYANSGTIGASLLTGTLTTAAQPNITSVGTLTDLSVSGNGTIGGNLVVNGNLVYVNVEELAVEDPIITLNTGANGAPPVSNSGKDVGTALYYYDTQARTAFMGWDTSNAEFAFGSQTSISSEIVTFTTLGNVRAQTFKGNIEATTIGGNLTTATQSNITTVGTLGSLSVTGNITAGNVGGANTISGNYLVSNSGCVSVNGAMIAFNSGTGAAGIFSSLATNINFGLSANIIMGSSSGNVTAQGNLIANGNISTSNNISGTLITGTLTTNAQPNVTSLGTLTGLTISGNVSANNATANTVTTNSTIGKRGNIAVTVDTVIDSFSASDYRTAKYVVKSENDNGYESLEVLLIHNNINSYITVYAAINDGGGNTIAVTTGINSGNVELRATGLAANTVVNLIGTYVPD